MDWTVRNWQDLGAIFSMASVLGLLVVYLQMRSGLNISNKEKALDAYIEFSKQFDALAEQNSKNKTRFLGGDRSLGVGEIIRFFRNLWAAHLHEWEFYQAGIIPPRVYARWIIYMHEYLTNGEIKYFFENGQEGTLSNVEGFERHGKRLLRHHPDFLKFIAEIRLIPHSASNDPQKMYKRVLAIVRRYRKRNYWNLR